MIQYTLFGWSIRQLVGKNFLVFLQYALKFSRTSASASCTFDLITSFIGMSTFCGPVFLHQSTFFSLGLAFCCTSFGPDFPFGFYRQFGWPHETQVHRQIGFIHPSRCLSHSDHVEFWAFGLADYASSHLDLLPVDAIGFILRFCIRFWRNLLGYPPLGRLSRPQ